MAPRTTNLGITILHSFVNLFLCSLFTNKFHIDTLTIVDFFHCVAENNDPLSTDVRLALQGKIEKRQESETPKTMFPNESPILQELGKEQMKQIFKAARAIVLYGSIDERVVQNFDNLLPTKKSTNSFILGTKYIPSKCSAYTRTQSPHKEPNYPFKKAVPTSFQVPITFHAYRMVSIWADKKHPLSIENWKNQGVVKSLIPSRNTKSGNRIEFAVQSLVTAWNSIAKVHWISKGR